MLWPDGALISGPNLIQLSGVTASFAGASGDRDSIRSLPGEPDIAVTRNQGVTAYLEDGGTLWNNGTTGCCDYNVDEAAPLDLDADQVVEVPWVYAAYDGSTVSNTVSGYTGSGLRLPVYGLMYPPRQDFVTGGGTVIHVDLLNNSSSTITLDADPGVNLGQGALTASQPPDLAVASTSGHLYLVEPTLSQVWTAQSFTGVGTNARPIVLASANALFVNTGDPGVSAYRTSDGGLLWSTALGGYAGDMLLGDDGLLYVFIPGLGRVMGLAVDTGSLVLEYKFVPTGDTNSADMLLGNGILYLSAGSTVVALRIGAQHYDPTAPWPVRFHDNQRTSYLGATSYP